MKNFAFGILLLLSFITLSSCNDQGQGILSGNDLQKKQKKSSGDDTKKGFIYNAMNYWYFWQDDVPELADNYFDNKEDKKQFLADYPDAEALYEGLQFKDDRFSFFIDDYEEFQDEQNGVYADLGFNYGYIGFKNSNDIVGYVQYIDPDGPAASTSLERLDLFTKVDGTTLNTTNFGNFLRKNKEHTLAMAEIGPNGKISETGEIVTVASERVTKNPIFKTAEIDTNGTRIGYMMYNAFQSNSHHELNSAFGDFKSDGIDELVLDLRYNGGGSVLTSQLLSSLVSGLDGSNKFADFTYNQKRNNQNEAVYFLDEVPIEDGNGDFYNSQGEFKNPESINSLSLSKLYVLTSQGTASASEALINGLKAYIDVVVIGTRTTGKDVGSLTLVDASAPYLDDEKANEDTNIAIQPIVLQFINADGKTYPYEYTDNGTIIHAFNPTGDKKINELTNENIKEKPAIGDPGEPVFGRAIDLILGNPIAKQRISEGVSAPFSGARVILDSQDLRPHGKEMYILPGQMKQIMNKK